MCNAIGVHEIVLIDVISPCQWQIKCAGLQQSLFPCFVCELLPNKTTGRQSEWQGARKDKVIDFFHGDLFITEVTRLIFYQPVFQPYIESASRYLLECPGTHLTMDFGLERSPWPVP